MHITGGAQWQKNPNSTFATVKDIYPCFLQIFKMHTRYYDIYFIFYTGSRKG